MVLMGWLDFTRFIRCVGGEICQQVVEHGGTNEAYLACPVKSPGENDTVLGMTTLGLLM